MDDYHIFEQAYCREVPQVLKVLYSDPDWLLTAPHYFPLSGKPFVVEVQYYHKLSDVREIDILNQLFAFAVNTDGFDMLVDLNGDDLPVLQRESGEIDCLDFTLKEFLIGANHPNINKL